MLRIYSIDVFYGANIFFVFGSAIMTPFISWRLSFTIFIMKPLSPKNIIDQADVSLAIVYLASKLEAQHGSFNFASHRKLLR